MEKSVKNLDGKTTSKNEQEKKESATKQRKERINERAVRMAKEKADREAAKAAKAAKEAEEKAEKLKAAKIEQAKKESEYLSIVMRNDTESDFSRSELESIIFSEMKVKDSKQYSRDVLKSGNTLNSAIKEWQRKFNNGELLKEVADAGKYSLKYAAFYKALATGKAGRHAIYQLYRKYETHSEITFDGERTYLNKVLLKSANKVDSFSDCDWVYSGRIKETLYEKTRFERGILFIEGDMYDGANSTIFEYIESVNETLNLMGMKTETTKKKSVYVFTKKEAFSVADVNRVINIALSKEGSRGILNRYFEKPIEGEDVVKKAI